MAYFSQRYGYSSPITIQLESMDDALKNRIWNLFFRKHCIKDELMIGFGVELSIVEKIMDKMGLVYNQPGSSTNPKALQKYLLNNNNWYIMYDFIEKYLDLLDKNQKKTVITEYNKILEEEVSGYRIIKGLVAPITSEKEIQAIINAAKSKYYAVNTHIDKALSLFANRKIPDYENSIKESISAVEALCKIIIGDDKATLGQALKKIESKGIQLHAAYKNALDSLYGYASDENGIRHAGVDFKNAPAEDARFMLITCSAFVNYLIEKWDKVNRQEV